MNARTAALQSLHSILYQGAYANITVRRTCAHDELSEVDKKLYTELVYGVLRHKNYLEWLVGRFSKQSLKKLDALIICILMLGFYQLIYLSRIPESAAVNESVRLAKQRVHPGAAGFVNAVLRQFLRRPELREIPTDLAEDLQRSLVYRQPLWIIKLLEAQYGEEETRKLCAYFLEIPDLHIRINTLQTTKEEVLRHLDELHIEYRPALVPDGLCLSQAKVAMLTDLLRSGAIYIQDQGAMLTAYAVDPQPADLVLDLCAAPGGKSLHMAALSQDQAQITACDIHPHKIQLLEENIRRGGSRNIRALLHDATEFRPDWQEKFHKVLVDAPCSGLGVLGRRPEMKWQRLPENLDMLEQLQGEILSRAAGYVKRGGKLIYSTCTLNRKENEKNIQKFLTQHPDFRWAAFSLPSIDNISTGSYTIWPPEHHCDGFYLAVLEKR